MSSSTLSRRVILFKQIPADGSIDKYAKLLSESGFDPEVVPTLSFEFCCQPEVHEALSHPGNYRGLLLTSQRAVEAAAASCIPADGSAAQAFGETIAPEWNERLVCSVGAATSLAATEQLALTSHFKDAGNAEQLADQLLTELSRDGCTHGGGDLPFLFLCGDLRRDTLPDKLRAASHRVHEIVCYRTTAALTLTTRGREITAELTGSMPEPGAEGWTWLVFFSPSGVEFSYASLLSQLSGVAHVRVAAIGKTTADALLQHGVTVHAVAKKPSADNLLEAIAAASTCSTPS
ncbi:uroporphyrinogen-III synthase-like [Sycon ciliatum]|uniref:uroporphyrinogen-III synthase-like n=1 Tax=Sycon ciliatum TaxID=27933 RepID=UPI0031F64D71